MPRIAIFSEAAGPDSGAARTAATLETAAQLHGFPVLSTLRGPETLLVKDGRVTRLTLEGSRHLSFHISGDICVDPAIWRLYPRVPCP